jgi:hypothetical protein
MIGWLLAHHHDPGLPILRACSRFHILVQLAVCDAGVAVADRRIMSSPGAAVSCSYAGPGRAGRVYPLDWTSRVVVEDYYVLRPGCRPRVLQHPSFSSVTFTRNFPA